VIRKKDLESKAEEVSRLSGMNLEIGWAYGRPRVFRVCSYGLVEFSPRLSKGDLWEWMDAWLTGYLAGTGDQR